MECNTCGSVLNVTILAQELVKQDLKPVHLKQYQLNEEQNSLQSHAQYTGRPHFPSANHCQGQLQTLQSLSSVIPQLHGSDNLGSVTTGVHSCTYTLTALGTQSAHLVAIRGYPSFVSFPDFL